MYQNPLEILLEQGAWPGVRDFGMGLRVCIPSCPRKEMTLLGHTSRNLVLKLKLFLYNNNFCRH